MGYDPGTIAHFRGILLTQRAELMARLQRNGDSVFAEELKGTDERNRAQMIEQHIVTTVGDSEHLRDIESALQKCEDATYGLCSACGTPISLARLEAIPIASRCKPCQAEHKSCNKPHEARLLLAAPYNPLGIFTAKENARVPRHVVA